MRSMLPVRSLILGLQFLPWCATLGIMAQPATVATVSLPTGMTYQVEVSGGKPIRQQPSGFKVTTLAPIVVRYTQPLRCDLEWNIVLQHPARRVRKLEVRCLNDGGPWTTVGQLSETQKAPDRALPYMTWKFSIYNRSGNSLIWKGFQEGNTYWAGFQFRFTFWEEGSEVQELTQFVKLYSWEMDSVLFHLAHCSEQAVTSRISHTLPLPNGKTGTAITVNGVVERALNEALRVAALTPALLPDPANPGSTRLVWILDGRLYWEGAVELLITSPQVPEIREAATLSEQGPFKMIFAPPDRCPQLWNWLTLPGETWLPLQIQVKRGTDGKVLEWIEWVLIPETAKTKLNGLLQGSRPTSKK